MKSSKKWLIALCVLIVAASAIAAESAWSNHEDRRKLQQAEQEDTALVRELSAALPVGMDIGEVHARLAARQLDSDDYNDEILIYRGKQPSALRFCGPADRYILVKLSTTGGAQPRCRR